MHAPDEACDPLVAAKPALVRVGAAEEAARLEEERVEALRVAPVRVEERKRAEARAEADPDRGLRQRGEDLLDEGARVARRGGVGLVAVDRAEEDGAKRGELPEERQEGGVLGVLGPVVGDEQRAALGRVRVRPDERG